MTRAIRTGGWTFLLLSTMYGSNVHAQRARTFVVRVRCRPPSPAPAAAAPQPAQAQPTWGCAFPAAAAGAADAQIVFADGNLSIHADNSSLAAILHQVASNSGMKIEGLGSDERVFGNFGPGAPRDVLADLLVGHCLQSGFAWRPEQRRAARTDSYPGHAGRSSGFLASPQANANADDGNNEPEAVEAPPPPPPRTAGWIHTAAASRGENAATIIRATAADARGPAAGATTTGAARLTAAVGVQQGRKAVPQGLKALHENDHLEIESVGTVELSPGRSPGLACAIEKSRRDDRKSYRDMVLDSGSGSGFSTAGYFEMEVRGIASG